MSWGERSCAHAGECPIPDECNINNCNVDCRMYRWDQKTKPDSIHKDYKDVPKPPPAPGPNRKQRRKQMQEMLRKRRQINRKKLRG